MEILLIQGKTKVVIENNGAYGGESGTLRSESEMERNPEVPASTREEALFH